jgi:hypothetical protein
MWMGMYGAHRFYVGKIGTGLLMVFTVGGLGIWWMVDIFKVLSETFEDSDGNVVTDQGTGKSSPDYDEYQEDPCQPTTSEKTPDNEKELILG